MLLNFKSDKVRAAIRPLFAADCERIARGQLPERAWETDIYVTRRCNMSCSYCYVKDYFDRDYPFVDPSLPQLWALIDALADKTYGLVVLGGEPLVRRDLAEILRYARERGIPSIRVATNGTLVKRAMEALRYVDRINVSLDGTRKHEFPEVVERMQRDICEVRQEMGRDFPSVCISYTLAQNDLFEQDILPVIRFARENGFDIKFLACKYPNNDVNWDFLRAVVERARGYVCDETLLNVRELTQKIIAVQVS